MALGPDLERTLTMIAEVAAQAAEPWWIIGSAAVALHGAPVAGIRDVDVLMERRDAERLLDKLGLSREHRSSDPQFRSELFATWRDPPLPVEIFAGFCLARGDGWRPVHLQSRQAIRLGSGDVFVPSAPELHRLLLSFGRPKDLERARVLEGL
jgi:hypothetical protein